MNNNIHYKVWNEINYSFQHFNNVSTVKLIRVGKRGPGGNIFNFLNVPVMSFFNDVNIWQTTSLKYIRDI